MRALIIFDSRYGNTEKIAFAIRDGLTGEAGAEVEVEAIRAVTAKPEDVAKWDLVLVGGPTHGTNPSPDMHQFLKRIPEDALAGVRMAAFDTRTDPGQLKGMARAFARILDRFGYAAPKISTALEKKGARIVKPPEGFTVLDMEGPLQEGELQRAQAWAVALARQLTYLCRSLTSP
jgi:flavodoxin